MNLNPRTYACHPDDLKEMEKGTRAMKLTMRPPITTTPSLLVPAIIQAHILRTAQEVLDALPDEIERMKKLENTKAAQTLTDFYNTLRKLHQEPEEPPVPWDGAEP